MSISASDAGHSKLRGSNDGFGDSGKGLCGQCRAAGGGIFAGDDLRGRDLKFGHFFSLFKYHK